MKKEVIAYTKGKGTGTGGFTPQTLLGEKKEKWKENRYLRGGRRIKRIGKNKGAKEKEYGGCYQWQRWPLVWLQVCCQVQVWWYFFAAFTSLLLTRLKGFSPDVELSKTSMFKYSRRCLSGPLPYCTGRHQLTSADKIKTNEVSLPHAL